MYASGNKSPYHELWCASEMFIGQPIHLSFHTSIYTGQAKASYRLTDSWRDVWTYECSDRIYLLCSIESNWVCCPKGKDEGEGRKRGKKIGGTKGRTVVGNKRRVRVIELERKISVR